MTRKKKVIRWLDLASLAMVAIFAFGWVSEREGWFDLTPFKNVRDISVSPKEDSIVLRARYTVTDRHCDFVPPIVVFGYILGVRKALEYTPIRQPNQTEQRHAGEQLMTLRIDIGARVVDRIEVYTRHDCDGKRVDTEMLAVDVPR